MGRHSSPRAQRLKGNLAASLLRVVSWLPLWANRMLGRTLGWLAWRLPSKEKRVAAINFSLCFPDLSEAERQKLLRRTLIETGKSAAESAIMWYRPDDAVTLIREVKGYDALRETVQSGRSVLLLVPHFGCWEVLNLWLAGHETIHALYNPSGLPALDRLIHASREHFGSTLYPATARGLGSLIRNLKRHPGVTGILPDQVPERGSGRFVPFYGQPAYTATLSAKLIHQLNARVFVGAAHRLPGTRGYILEFSDPDPDIYDADLDTALTALNRSIEQLIALAPEQYLWAYQRFRRRPPGREKVYR